MVQLSFSNFSLRSSKISDAMSKGAVAGLVLLALSGCKAKEPDAATPLPVQALEPSARGVFGTSGSVWTVVNNPTQQIRFEGGSVTGFGGCNSFRAEVKLKGAFVSFGPIAATKKGCEPEIAQSEANFFDRLNRAHSFHGSSVRASVIDDSGIGLVKFVQTRQN